MCNFVAIIFAIYRQQWYDDRLQFGSKVSAQMKGRTL